MIDSKEVTADISFVGVITNVFGTVQNYNFDFLSIKYFISITNYKLNQVNASITSVIVIPT